MTDIDIENELAALRDQVAVLEAKMDKLNTKLPEPDPTP